MGNGSTRHGDAAADQARDEFQQLDRELEQAIDRAEIREEMQSAHDMEEDSKLTAALMAQKPAVVVLKDGSKSDRPSKPPRNLWGALRWALVAIGTGAVLAIAQAVQSCHGK